MTTLADRSIDALRADHDRLVTLVAGLDADALTGPSAASDWTVADVLSHLGSGAEIMRYAVLAAVGQADGDAPANQEVWDRWNAMAPADQASGFLGSDAALLAVYDGITADQRETLQLDLGFGRPLPFVTTLGMRLNEVAAHGWDVAAGLDAAAELDDGDAGLLLEHYATTLGFLIGHVAEADAVAALAPARIGVGPAVLVLDGEGARVESGSGVGVGDADARLGGPLGAAVRLVTGRLKPPYVPDGIAVVANDSADSASRSISLADLQRIFPGY